MGTDNCQFRFGMGHNQHQHQQQVAYQWHQHQGWTQHKMYEAPSQTPQPPPPPPKRYLIAGKSCGKESPDKKDDSELWSNVEAQAAFLGPNLWEKTLSYDSDLKYVDLDEFLSENGIPVEGGGVGVGGGGNPVVKDTSCGRISPPNTSQPPGMLPKRERSPSPSEPMSPLTINPPSPADSSQYSLTDSIGQSFESLSFASSSRDFDPRTRAFSDEELKPQPMVKKSRKQVEMGGGSDEASSTFSWQGLGPASQDSDFVPDGLKDEKYWARRRKNNMAAKRSRDARRLKENQIALRAGFLEKENLGLRQEMERLKKENMTLRDRLSKYTTEI
ncbi:hepatic leukemia factor-like isoform X2 [Macrosteles quadrilineatus]|uniref:hepatic leukemia factor-like isoform X2 n=1 Tax=Macrosteles quadrilineatus TaxID=74068 RepID=UPI0023E1830B|nr:hepatic leukemia factor-like isoform X2 [Macrosteles quadrilineatus]XP_054274492.1 hepatic leukemia factor-like isoform X2 [Macrosteles quadrilineatus]XP_054274493.1 hepatic leukemia factor-like isoform X2 [Macrosteles quadrilineatus]XP_054274494.1 hepatic leukemia factor-like isoform X2 [Macrosteles quadrilineatus]